MHACMHDTFAMTTTSSTFALNFHDCAPGREAGRRRVIVAGHATLDKRRKPPPRWPWSRARQPTGCGFGSYARRVLAHHKLMNMSR